MKKNKRTHTPEFKAGIAMEALRGRYSVKELAAANDINPSLIHAWRQNLIEGAAALFANQGKEKDAHATHAARHLDRQLAELRAEQEWMRRAVAAMGLQQKRSCVEGDSALSLLRKSRLLGLHRSGLYYQKRKQTREAFSPVKEDSENAAINWPTDGHGTGTLEQAI